MSGYPCGAGAAPRRAGAADLAALAPYLARPPACRPRRPGAAPVPARRPPPAGGLPAALRALACDDPVDRARHGIGRSPTATWYAACAGSSPPGRPGPAAEREQGSGGLDWASAPACRWCPRRRQQRGGRRRAPGLDAAGEPGPLPARRAGRGRQGRRGPSGCGAGTLGPAAEAALKPHGLTLRFYPQSFERSSIGGWVADPGRRPLLDPADPHRRPGRAGHRRHPRRGLAVPPAARIRRRSEPRPSCCSAARAPSASSPRPGCGPSRRRRTRWAATLGRGQTSPPGRRTVRAAGAGGAAPRDLPSGRRRRGGP